MFWYSAYNLLLTLVIGAGYYQRMEVRAPDLPLAVIANVSHYGIHWLVAGTLLWLLSLAIRNPRARSITVAGLTTFCLLVLYVDMKIYQVYRYHFNGVIVNLVFGGGLGESVRLGSATYITFFLTAAAVTGAEFLYFQVVAPAIAAKPALNRWRTKLALVGALLAFYIADKALYGIDALYNNTGHIRFTRPIPGYIPFSMRKFAERHLGYRVEREEMFESPSRGGLLNYPPLERLLHPPTGVRPNILFLVPDGWRSDLLNPVNTPRIEEFSRSCWRYREHFSGGNTTEYGLFSLLYGIPGTYWSSFLAERRGPVLVDLLRLLGYEFRIISSTRLNLPELNQTVFINVRKDIRDELEGDRPAVRDARQPTEFFRFLDRERNPRRPFFAFLYFDSTHGPYDCPPEFARFQPTGGEINYLSVDEKKVAMHFNRYKNGLLFLDGLMGEVFDGLAKRGLLDLTVVVVTGDHGEEFWESGYYGHTDAFTSQQCRTGCIIRWPGRLGRDVRVTTTHQSIAPTLLEGLGYPELAAQYTTGAPSLLSPRPPTFWSVAGYHSCGVWTDNRIVTFNVDRKKKLEFEVRDHSYRSLPPAERRRELKALRPLILGALDEQRRFYR